MASKHTQVSGLVQSLGYHLMVTSDGKKKFAPAGRYRAEAQIDVYGGKNFDYACKIKTTGAKLHLFAPEANIKQMYNVQISPNHFALFPTLAAIETWARQELAARAEAEIISRATADLLASGLTSDQFSVERRNGETVIILFMSLERQLTYAEKLSEHFGVYVTTRDSQPFYMIVAIPGERIVPDLDYPVWGQGIYIDAEKQETAPNFTNLPAPERGRDTREQKRR